MKKRTSRCFTWKRDNCLSSFFFLNIMPLDVFLVQKIGHIAKRNNPAIKRFACLFIVGTILNLLTLGANSFLQEYSHFKSFFPKYKGKIVLSANNILLQNCSNIFRGYKTASDLITNAPRVCPQQSVHRRLPVNVRWIQYPRKIIRYLKPITMSNSSVCGRKRHIGVMS